VEDEEDLKSRKERAQVRLQIWLGLSKYQSEWRNSTPGGEVAVYAETVCKIDTFLPGNIFLRALKRLRLVCRLRKKAIVRVHRIV